MDNISIGVTPIIENVTLNAGVNNQVIDITLIETAEVVQLDVAPNLIEINIIRSEGEVQILQFASYSNFPTTGKANFFYLAKDTNKLYRWTGTTYAELNALGYTAENVANKGIANGYAGLDSGGKVPSSQLPSYVDDVIEVANYAALPATGETGKIYITLDTNAIYRWSGSVYVEISTDKAVWGGITGTLANQTDLVAALATKQDDLNGTGFVKVSGTTVFYDNNSYLTTGSAASTYVPYTGATEDVNLGSNELTAGSFIKVGGTSSQFLKADGSVDSTDYPVDEDLVHKTGDESIGGVKSFTDITKFEKDLYIKQDSNFGGIDGYAAIGADTGGIFIKLGTDEGRAYLVFNNLTNSPNFIFPNATGTIALTSDIPSLSGYVPTSRTISTTSPLTGGGSLAGNLTLSILKADTSTNGYLSSVDWNTFNNKQAALNGGTGFVKSTAGVISYDGTTYVPSTRTLTIDGTTWDLSQNRNFDINFPVTSFNTRTGAIVLNSGDVTTALGYTPYNATNPANYIDASALAPYLLLAGGTMTGQLNGTSASYSGNVTALSFIKTGGTSTQFLKADGTVDSNVYALESRLISTSGPLSGGGSLAANRTISISKADTDTDGYLSSTDWDTFNDKQAALSGTGIVVSTAGVITYDTNTYLTTAAAASTYVPYTGATANVDLGTHTLSSHDLVVNHSSGSGVAASITKGGNGEALTVVKSSGSGNAASITGGVTLLDELHLNTDLADAYIASASTWNAKQNALNGTGIVVSTAGVISYDTNTYALDSGVVHLTGDETIAGTKDFTGVAKFTNGVYLKHGTGLSAIAGYNLIDADTNGIYLGLANLTKLAYLNLNSLTDQRNYVLPDASGTIALTSDIPAAYTLPTASTSVLGGVKVDGTSITINGSGVISSAGSYTLPTATDTVLGGVKIGSGISISSGVISVSTSYLPLSGGTLTGNVQITPQSGSWAEGLSFSMPTTSTWGGLRWRRERANNDGNWYIGFTALDSTDDLVFGANNDGSQVNNILRLTKAGAVSTSGSFTSTGLIRVNGNTNLYLDYNYGQSIVGKYDSYKFQGIFAMGDAYKLAIDGSNTGNLYGLAWAHPNAGGQAGNLNNHGLLVMINGVTAAAISSNIWNSGSTYSYAFRGNANVAGTGSASYHPAGIYSTGTNWLYGTMYLNGNSINEVSNLYSGGVYSSNWFRAQGDCGMYSQDYGGHIRRSLATSFGNWETFGYNRSSWGGFAYLNNYYLNMMMDASGNHGFYQENGRGWTLFFSYSNNCWGIGTDNTYSGDGFRCIKYGSSQYGWTTWSDRRAKENIANITGALDKVLAMRGVYFNYISDEEKNKRVGFIAQELELVLPEAVRYAEEIDEYNVEYAQITSVLAEAIKEQQSQIEEQKSQIEELKALVNQLLTK